MKTTITSIIAAIRARGGLTLRLSLAFAMSAGLIFGAAFIYNYYMTTELAIDDEREKSRFLARSIANRFMDETETISGFIRHRAAQLEQGAVPDIGRFVRENMEFNRAMYGSAAAFEPDSVMAGRRYYAPYWFRNNGALAMKMLGGPSYDYFSMDWYRVPRELHRPAWSEPYYDTGGGEIPMATYSAPIHQGSGDSRRFRGVVTADLSLQWLRGYLSTVRLYRSGYAFIISRAGRFISHPDEKLVLKETIFSVAERRRDNELKSIGTAMTGGRSGFREITDFHSGRNSYVYFTPLLDTGWSLGIMIPSDELFEGERTLAMALIAIGVGGFILMTLVIVLIARTIARPVRTLALATERIARGDLDEPLPAIATGDEIGQLAVSFDGMRLSLKEYIANLAAATATRERIEFELKLAHQIQTDFLPLPIDPAQRSRFDLYAIMEPAREVGGDLYDHVLGADGRLTILVGDVSGKGVPAALFMAVTITLFRNVIADSPSPAEAISRLNRTLCDNNKSRLFVTAFCAVFDPATGELRYANAGHNPPVLAGGSSGPRFLDIPECPAMGILPEAVYGEMSITLGPGEALLVYSDGVTEAMTTAREQFSEENLLATASRADFSDAGAAVRLVLDDVRRFTAGAPQSDDITIMALVRRG
ncbi:MAG: SpoIIE family protein phosphatase [Spirochaetes bacterium]|nr:SpoIIE family protein phosphatase [Spirochaetota bacterium]